MTATEDRQYMGTPAEAAEALIAKAREWRETRQPFMGTRKQHRDRDAREHQVRFELANAALLWLWHQENPAP